MPKKERPEPLTEGELANIYRWFFAPLIVYKPADMPIKDWMEILFHFKDRDIVRYVARAEFMMPGLFYEAAARKIQGLGYRKVAEGDEVFVRRDVTMPNSIDVEVNGGAGTQVFNLNQVEYNRIGAFLEEAERKRKK